MVKANLSQFIFQLRGGADLGRQGGRGDEGLGYELGKMTISLMKELSSPDPVYIRLVLSWPALQ